MNITVVTPPPFEPVTLAQVYDTLKLDPDIDNGESPAVYSHPLDAMLRRQITAARQWVEQETGRALIQQTLRLTMEGWPYPYGRPLRLYRLPVLSLSSVSYYDGDN